jgi:hypothetical protein
MLFVRDKDKPMVARVLVIFSLVATGFAALGALAQDVYLASTQWLLVAAVLGIWGVYLLLEAEFRS